MSKYVKSSLVWGEFERERRRERSVAVSAFALDCCVGRKPQRNALRASAWRFAPGFFKNNFFLVLNLNFSLALALNIRSWGIVCVFRLLLWTAVSALYSSLLI